MTDASGEEIKVSDANVVYGVKNADSDDIVYSESNIPYKDAGEYTVYYKVTADNYEDVTGDAVVNIAPKPVNIEWSDTEFTYDGQAHAPIAKVSDSDVISGDTVEVMNVMVAPGIVTKDAGNYTAQATALSNSNYTIATAPLLNPGNATTSYEIRRAKAVVKVENAEKHIGKDDPTFTYKVTGVVEGEALNDVTVTRIAGETAGEHEITATVTEGSNPNYDITFAAGILTIKDHVMSEKPVVENRVEATCTTDGSYDEVYYCTVDDCKAEVKREHQTIPAAGHKYGKPEFTWNEDKSTATATFTCANDEKHVEKVEATVTSETIDATCTWKGQITYTASVLFGVKVYTDVKKAEIPATGHTVVVDKAVAATCTQAGISEGSRCSVCGEVLTEQIIRNLN